MPLERTGRRELAQLVAHHVLRHVHWDELSPVVNRHRVADKFRENGRPARPGAHYFLLISRTQHRQLDFEVRVGKRSLFYASAHALPLFALAVDDPLIGALVVARLEAARGLAPRRHRMTAAAGSALAAAVRVIHRIHGDAAVMRHLAHPALAARLAERYVLMLDVAHLA